MIRVHMALFGLLAALLGHSVPVLLVVGLAAMVPLALRLLALPAAGRGVFLLTAVAAGLFLAVGLAGHSHPAQPRPVAAAHVTEVCHR